MKVSAKGEIPAFDAYESVLPVVVFDKDSGKILDATGTGFVIGNIFVTYWHCVSATQKAPNAYGVALPSSGYKILELRRLEQDANKTDLAVAIIDHVPKEGSRLYLANKDEMTHGSDVSTFGYPMPDSTLVGAEKKFTIHPRYFEGYVMRSFRFMRDGYGVVPSSLELDMPGPKELSGAPIIQRGISNVAGVFYGTIETEYAGQKWTFALAHVLETLRAVRGTATGGKPLGDLG